MKLRDMREKLRAGEAVLKPPTKLPKESDGFIDLVDIEAELTKRGVDPESVINITIDKPERGTDRLDVELDDGSVLKISKGVTAKVVPAKPFKVDIVMTAKATSGPASAPREVPDVESLMRMLERTR